MNTLVQSAGARAAPQNLARLTAQQILDGYRSGRFTPRDVIDEVIAALETTDARCKVIATDMFASARAEADRATAAWKNGEAKALTGVPVTIKDLIYVAGTPANGGAPMLDGFVPDIDSAVVTAVKAAGAIVTCKTTTCEVRLQAHRRQPGVGDHAQSLVRSTAPAADRAAARRQRSRLAAARSPSAPMGSARSGCRVRFAACSGSNRPSAWCRGRRVSFRRHGRRWHIPGRSPAPSPTPRCFLKSSPAMTRAIRAACRSRGARLRPAAAGSTGCASDSVPISATPRCAGDVRMAFKQAVDTLANLGANMVADDPGVEPDILEHVLQPIAFTEQAAAISERDPVLFVRSEEEYRAVIAKGRTYSGVDYMRATHRRMTLRGRFGDLFRRVDALITPTVAVTAFDAGTHRRRRDRWPQGGPSSRLVAVHLADQPCRPASRDGALRFRSRRPADRLADRRAVARGGDHSLDRRRIRTGAAVVGPMANARRQLRCAAA